MPPFSAPTLYDTAPTFHHGVSVSSTISLSSSPSRQILADVEFVSNNDMNGEGHYTGEINKVTRLPHGRGSLRYTSYEKKNCIAYTGLWENGLRHGHGSLEYTTGVYVGNFDRDVREGFGFFRWADGAEYQGDFSQDTPNGRGKFQRKDGSTYYGDFKNGHMHGLGTMEYENGDFGVFNWNNGKILTKSEQKRSKNRKRWAKSQPQEEIILV
ncbi:unnamed protein product [Cylindrotheca closterium]|uniref:MORN repeat-containing protein 5 n=1 Tax=Cylindrotheca closterium TaxID=2856 RepID=A0AAD2FRV2_9STRA|nr:unnamed protein product [Cylindrotheca closterium]